MMMMLVLFDFGYLDWGIAVVFESGFEFESWGFVAIVGGDSQGL